MVQSYNIIFISAKFFLKNAEFQLIPTTFFCTLIITNQPTFLWKMNIIRNTKIWEYSQYTYCDKVRPIGRKDLEYNDGLRTLLCESWFLPRLDNSCMNAS